MNRRRLNPRLRIQFLGLCMLLGCGALGLRLWWVQVARGAEWTARIRGSSEATVRLPSVRGEIKDRNGLTLVGNRASYEVDFYLPEMVKGYQGTLRHTADVNLSGHHPGHAQGSKGAGHHQDCE